MLVAKPDRPLARVSALLNATQIVANLAQVDGWRLDGDGPLIAIEKHFRFRDFAECLGFVQALGWVARRLDHAPVRVSIEATDDAADGAARAVCVRWSTPCAGGLSAQDFDAAQRTDALLH